MQADFRASERDYRSSTETSVSGRTHVVQADDNISTIVGSSHPQAVGNFMAANGMSTDRLNVGDTVFVPDSWQAYGDQSTQGQGALNAGNVRIAAANQNNAANEHWEFFGAGNTGATTAAPGSFEALSQAAPSGQQNLIVDNTGRTQPNLAWVGVNGEANAVPPYYRQPDSNEITAPIPAVKDFWRAGTDVPLAQMGDLQRIIDNPQSTWWEVMGARMGVAHLSDVVLAAEFMPSSPLDIVATVAGLPGTLREAHCWRMAQVGCKQQQGQIRKFAEFLG
ncbi:LysM peptidoglycan-binding domain-containing protein [Rhodoferax sp. AJA081-3]|uniref:LysM peptidoglycan-binding domain-containing protein n=1 Tax=Rhodoferax sp. AJA081-3 TaxID=2752316 RepID=UPI001AE0054A|nr:LysM peptidoglycan-binding domain-containing protein [Rhodoferax sp. AJA081-3]QTN30404.1 LysM peptidoglycan-binding domain-containing protein [Rhodoferax sp. AJA081-3]